MFLCTGATVKATNSETKPGNDENFTLAVSVLDASTGTPLKCIVALDGDKNTPSDDGHIVCFLSLSVDVVGEHQSRNSKKQYNIWRN